jgi:TPR repeat protein
MKFTSIPLLELLAESLILDSEMPFENARGYRLAVKFSESSAHMLFLMGLAELRGTGTCVDTDKAVASLTSAHMRGSAKAAGVLGYLYDIGLGVKKDDFKAFRLYLCAAISGDVDGMVNVAACYYDGIGVTCNRAKSVVWMKRASRCYACFEKRLEHNPCADESQHLRGRSL